MATICPACGTEEEGICVHEKALIGVFALMIVVGAVLIVL